MGYVLILKNKENELYKLGYIMFIIYYIFDMLCC